MTRPPAKIIASALTLAARRIERLKTKRRAMLKKLDALNGDLRAAVMELNAIAQDAAREPLGGSNSQPSEGSDPLDPAVIGRS